MKKPFLHFLALSISLVFGLQSVSAATCNLGAESWINGNWTLTSSCTLATGAHFINGDVTIGSWILTIPTNSMLVMDLALKKMTFTTGKTLLEGNSLIKYIWNASFSSSSNTTACPSGQNAVNPTSLADAPANLTSNNTGVSGRFYCR